MLEQVSRIVENEYKKKRKKKKEKRETSQRENSILGYGFVAKVINFVDSRVNGNDCYNIDWEYGRIKR